MTIETKETIEKEVRRLVKDFEGEFGVTCELTYEKEYPAMPMLFHNTLLGSNNAVVNAES